MRFLPAESHDPNLLVGIDNTDDGSVYKLTDDIALIQSLDFFTPIVDDPYKFGQIAAANALSDIYAMGGEPKTALNIVAYPIEKLKHEILANILQGARDKVNEADAQIVGGHSIDDEEPKFGLSVTGIVHPDKFYKNIGAKPGDVLILTKPIGAGILTTALKRGQLTADENEQMTHFLTTLNKYAAECLRNVHPHAVTDVTGFGLLGHAYEMAHGSNVSFTIEQKNVPLLRGTKKLANENTFPAGAQANYKWLKDAISFSETISHVEKLILCDPMTSGGLLISLPEEDVQKFMTHVKRVANEVTVIGEVIERKEQTIYVK